MPTNRPPAYKTGRQRVLDAPRVRQDEPPKTDERPKVTLPRLKFLDRAK